MSPTKKVLITGASGFTGVYVKRALESAGHEVFGTTLNAKEGLIQVNLTQFEDVATVIGEIKPTSIVHLAGMSFAGETDVKGFYSSNVLGTRNLLSATERLAPNIDSVIIASSASVYGANRATLLSESSDLEPLSDYAVSKACVELVAKSWMNRLPLTITRPFNYTGIGQSQNFIIPKILSAFANRRSSLTLGNTSVSRDFSDVRDIADVYRRLVERPGIGEVFNIASGKAVSLTTVLKIASTLTGHKLSIKKDPALMRPNEVEHQSGNAEKLRNLLNLKSWREIDETIEWMLSGSDVFV
jgi:GDP-6-deoxy-D-talose 4-dehydrogenase